MIHATNYISMEGGGAPAPVQDAVKSLNTALSKTMSLAESRRAVGGAIMSVVWELLASNDISQEYAEFVQAPTSGGEFGQVTLYAQEPPKIVCQLEAKHVPPEEMQPIRNKALRRATPATFTLSQIDPATGSARQVTGLITQFSERQIEGTWDFDVRVSVRRTDLNVAQASIVDYGTTGALHL